MDDLKDKCVEKFGKNGSIAGLKLYHLLTQVNGKSRHDAISEMAAATNGMANYEEVAMLADLHAEILLSVEAENSVTH